jgi:hypothetical protein
MRLRAKYLHRYQASRPTPSYLLPAVPREVIFDPSLRRARDLLAEAQGRLGH